MFFVVMSLHLFLECLTMDSFQILPFIIMQTSLDHTILQSIGEDGSNVASRLAAQFGVTRQTASAWLSGLKKKGLICSSGRGPGVHYQLATLEAFHKIYERFGLQEDIVWSELFVPALKGLPENVIDIWQYAVTEMVNNAIDHSGSETVEVALRRDALNTTAYVADTGEGIFLKIQRALNLFDPREAILELAKGKLTTDPANHTGEGIFFSSKVMDEFDIRSGHLHFMHDGGGNDWLFEKPADALGTWVLMRLANDSITKLSEVFDQYALPEEFTFAKTIVPVRLAQHEGEKLVSRSQAKRLTMRFERFETVMLDFSGVEEIGQAFADEVFRVFQKKHPGTQLLPINMTISVENMFKRVIKDG